jgi:crossover junction endodeoxyribonuclease RuvC
LERTGIAVVDGAPSRLTLVHWQRLDTVPQTSGAGRLANLFDLVSGVAVAYQPDVAAVEQLFFSTNRRTAMRVSEARGVILCALAVAGVSVVEYTPTQVKSAVCGYGGARKPQVARMVTQLLNVESASDDVTDACAVAVCHHHRASLRVLSQRPRAAAPSRLDVAVARARARLNAVPR